MKVDAGVAITVAVGLALTSPIGIWPANYCNLPDFLQRISMSSDFSGRTFASSSARRSCRPPRAIVAAGTACLGITVRFSCGSAAAGSGASANAGTADAK